MLRATVLERGEVLTLILHGGGDKRRGRYGRRRNRATARHAPQAGDGGDRDEGERQTAGRTATTREAARLFGLVWYGVVAQRPLILPAAFYGFGGSAGFTMLPQRGGMNVSSVFVLFFSLTALSYTTA